MKLLKLFFLVFLLPLCAPAEVYKIERLSERELLRTYESILRDACRHSDQFWTASKFDPAAGYWGDGVNDGNQGIRAIGHLIFTSGVLLKYSDILSEAERASDLSKVIAALRFVTATHVTGTQKCSNGKPWGDSWQSAMWTGNLAFGAWLVWDKLDSQLQKDVERIIAAEADRFLKVKPPGGSFSNTKAEENAWNLTCISIAANMFPDHPHAAAWNEKAIEYAINTFSSPQDRDDKRLVDGKPLAEWYSGENVHSDFTLENHGFFHPAYVACSSYMLTESVMHFVYARRPVPEGMTHHLVDVWKVFREIILPCGEPAYPQGMDWELHGINAINLFASLGTYRNDPLAARLEKNCLQYLRAWQQMENGNMAVPGSKLGFTRHAICAEQAAFGYLAHKIFGPATKEISAGKSAADLSAVRAYEFAEFILHRTRNKFFSFSWKNRIMGLLAPIGDGHDDNPLVTVPIINGFVGSIDLNPAGKTKTKVVDHAWKETPKGFETTGTLLTNDERLKQMLCVMSVGENTVIYQDRVIALTNISVVRERGVPIGIENDKLTGGTRTVSHQGSKITFDWTKPQQPVSLSGGWANVDGRLGIVMVAGSGANYSQASGYDRIAVYTDILYGSYSDRPMSFQAGEEVARRVAVVFAEVSPAKTAELAQACKIVDTPAGQVLRLKLPEGGKMEVPLL